MNLKKKFLFLSLMMISMHTSYAQIEMFDEIVKKVENPIVLPYDSLNNITPQKYGLAGDYKFTLHHLIGQTLLYCGDPVEDRTNEILKRESPFVKGAYYRVDGILPDDERKGKYQRMQLTNIETGERIEEGNIFTDQYNFKWVVVGHYEKMKSLYLNKEFVFVGTDNVFIENKWDKANGLICLETDTVTLNVPKESVWTCIGIQVKPRKFDDRMAMDKRSPIVLLFDNPTFGKHYCYLESSNGKPYVSLISDSQPYLCGRFQLKSYYDNIKANNDTNFEKRMDDELIKKFGVTNSNLILDGV